MKWIARIGMMRTAAIGIAVALSGYSTGMAQNRKQKQVDRNAVHRFDQNSPNRSYQTGPHTRVYVTTRSWLDAGTEVLPGERKFSDYGFPPGYSFARENNNRPLDRQPLNPASDMGGYFQGLLRY